MSDNKDRLTYRPEPETKQKIERWYQEDNCRSKNKSIAAVKRTNGQLRLEQKLRELESDAWQG